MRVRVRVAEPDGSNRTHKIDIDKVCLAETQLLHRLHLSTMMSWPHSHTGMIENIVCVAAFSSACVEAHRVERLALSHTHQLLIVRVMARMMGSTSCERRSSRSV